MRVLSECVVCHRAYEQNAHGSQLLCKPCYRSLQTAGCSLYDSIAWSAQRAWRFARKAGVTK